LRGRFVSSCAIKTDCKNENSSIVLTANENFLFQLFVILIVPVPDKKTLKRRRIMESQFFKQLMLLCPNAEFKFPCSF